MLHNATYSDVRHNELNLLRFFILLSIIFLSSCSNDDFIIGENQNVLTDTEQSEVESTFRSFNQDYEIFIDAVITITPEQFSIKKANHINHVRFYISPVENNTSVLISSELQQVISQTTLDNLNKQILQKYTEQNEVAKGLIVTSNSLVTHLNKKGFLEKKEPSQKLAYVMFLALILSFIILIWISHRSKNKMNLYDIWTDAYKYED